MSIIIGGSGSSGSTMLISKLSTHPKVFSGGEINFFNKEQLFENWNSNKMKILPYFPYYSTKGWHIFRRNTLSREAYGWSKSEVKALLKKSDSINSFSEDYFNRPLQKKGAEIWIEKTPSNCYSFSHFLTQFPEGKVIHITRNPLDTVASIYNKDPRPFNAVGNWLYNNAMALTACDSERYHLVKYEDLVFKTDETFKKLCDFIGIDEAKLELDSGGGNKQIKTWDNNPSGKISKSSMGKFEKLSQEIKDEIYTAFENFEISDSHKNTKNIKYADFQSISEKLGYDTTLHPKNEMVDALQKDLKKDKLMRTLKMYATGGNYYPLQMK